MLVLSKRNLVTVHAGNSANMFIGTAAAAKYSGFHPDTTDTEFNTHNNNTVNFFVDTLEPEADIGIIIIIIIIIISSLSPLSG